MGAGRLEPGPGQHQKRLGGGRHITDRRRLHRRLQKLAEALQKVCPPRRRVHQNSSKINILIALIVLKLLMDSHLFVFTPRTNGHLLQIITKQSCLHKKKLLFFKYRDYLCTSEGKNILNIILHGCFLELTSCVPLLYWLQGHFVRY